MIFKLVSMRQFSFCQSVCRSYTWLVVNVNPVDSTVSWIVADLGTFQLFMIFTVFDIYFFLPSLMSVPLTITFSVGTCLIRFRLFCLWLTCKKILVLFFILLISNFRKSLFCNFFLPQRLILQQFGWATTSIFEVIIITCYLVRHKPCILILTFSIHWNFNVVFVKVFWLC